MSKSENKLRLNKKFLYLAIGITILNIILYYIAGRTNIKFPGNSEGPSLAQQIINFYLGFIFISAFIGVIIALIPYKKLNYLEKLIRSSTIIYLLLNILLLILSVRSIIMFSF